MVALALDGGIGQGREGQDGHDALCHRAPGVGKISPAGAGRSTSEPAVPMSQQHGRL